MKIGDILIPVAATPVLQAILKTIGLLDLTPVTTWGFGTAAQVITYLLAAGIAAVAFLWPAKKNLTKILLLLLGLGLLVFSFWAYTSVAGHPMSLDTEWYYDKLGKTTFFTTYASFGFVAGRIVKFITNKTPTRTSKP